MSGKIKDGSSGGAARKPAHPKASDEKKGRKQRAGDIGRAPEGGFCSGVIAVVFRQFPSLNQELGFSA